jgi:hypothetical protein
MPYTITHQGVPVGSIELPRDGDRFTVAVQPLPAYSAIQPLVRQASAALANVALGRSANAVALQHAAALGRAVELRDSTGALVPVDFIELTDWPGSKPEVAAFIRLRGAHARVQARVSPQPRGDSDTSAPAA